MTDIAPLNSALSRFTQNVKARIADQANLSTAEMNRLLDELTAQFEEQQAAAGEDSSELPISSISEKHLNLGAGTVIDCSAANHFTKTISGATTLSLENVYPAGQATSFVLNVINAGNNLTLWPSINWTSGVRPVLSANGRDVLAFVSYDGGLTWDGFLVGQDMKAAA